MAALQAAAARLFAEQGYDATTVAQIARAAQVGERTFYRYFAGKNELLAGQARGWIEDLHRAILERPACESPYQAVTRAMTAAIASVEPGGEGAWLLGGGQPLAAIRRVTPRPLRRLEQAISDAALDRMRNGPGANGPPGAATGPGGPAADFDAQLLARTAVAVLRTAVLYHRERGGPGVPGIQRLLQDAFGRLSDLAGPPPGNA
jgi:AcrR family transcriptional regulator